MQTDSGNLWCLGECQQRESPPYWAWCMVLGSPLEAPLQAPWVGEQRPASRAPGRQPISQHTPRLTSKQPGACPVTARASHSLSAKPEETATRLDTWASAESAFSMPPRRILSPPSIWDVALVAEAFREHGIKSSHVARLYKCVIQPANSLPSTCQAFTLQS